MAINMTTGLQASTPIEKYELEARLNRLDYLITTLEPPTEFLRIRLNKLYGERPLSADNKEHLPNVYSYLSQFDELLSDLETRISILSDEILRLENF